MKFDDVPYNNTLMCVRMSIRHPHGQSDWTKHCKRLNTGRIEGVVLNYDSVKVQQKCKSGRTFRVRFGLKIDKTLGLLYVLLSFFFLLKHKITLQD